MQQKSVHHLQLQGNSMHTESRIVALESLKSDLQNSPPDWNGDPVYKNDPEILAMTNLIAAYQRNEILEFEKILKSNRRTIMDDPFIRNHIEDLLKKIRTQVLLKLIKPYTRIRIPFLSQVPYAEPRNNRCHGAAGSGKGGGDEWKEYSEDDTE
ncbi:hypothetical protein Droror1_Dr00024658 [Drosera rotundifolia]